jgi:hypothetical protein
MAANYEENPADFHGSAFPELLELTTQYLLIIMHHLDGLLNNHSLKRYHLGKFGLNNSGDVPGKIDALFPYFNVI